jgi:hypothetical protein
VLHPRGYVRRTLRITREAPIACAGFVGFIDEMDSSCDLIGIDVPKSLLCESKKRSPSCETILWSRLISQRKF